MRKASLQLMGSSTFAVHVSSFADGIMQGTFTVPTSSAQTEFKSLTGLIVTIDELLDRQEEEGVELVRPADPAFKPTFELEVLFRQNHSWQGRIRFVETQREATFRSVLELLIILETVLGE